MAQEGAARGTTSWLGDSEVLLHIGVHKTGTTAVQASLAAARPRLVELGVTYAADTESHFHAALAVLGRRRGWERGGQTIDISRWEALAEEVRATPGKVVLSSEVFCEASEESARRIIDELGGDRVRVAITLRPLEQLMPSTWQQYVKTGFSLPYDDWLTDMLKGPDGASETPTFWMRNDHGRLVRRWVDVVGPERVAVLVVDSSRPLGLYESFEGIIGLPAETLTKDDSAPSNRSLSASEVEVIRRLNVEVHNTMDFSVYHRLIRRGGILHLVENRRPPTGEPRLTTPGWAVAKARDFSSEAVDQIRSSGVVVFGELDDLVPATPLPPDDMTQPETVPDEVAVMLLRGTLDAAAAILPAPGRQASGVSLASGRELVRELRRRAKRRLTPSPRPE